jgi:hypothetical protein
MLGKILLSLLLLVVVPAKSIDLAKTKTYVSEDYVYMYIASGIFDGAEGYLFYKDTIIIGKSYNQTVNTPWRKLYWHGVPPYRYQYKGWLPYANLRFPVPK